MIANCYTIGMMCDGSDGQVYIEFLARRLLSQLLQHVYQSPTGIYNDIIIVMFL